MLFRSFTFSFLWRILVFSILLGVACHYAHPAHNSKGLAIMAGMGTLWAAYSLFYYINDTNRRLARFFESVRYSDFAVRFSSAKDKGDSFEQVNRQFNDVLEAFRQTRAEKEANLLFMNALVQHLTTGVLAFDAQDNLLLSNSTALQLLDLYRIQRLHDLPDQHRALVRFVTDLHAKGKMLYQPDTNRELAVQGIQLSLQGRSVRLLTLQNIQPELQNKETDAWRDLTRVLRHEIMNSVTPIISIVETMQDIVQHDLPPDSAGAEDLREALDVVATRSRGLMAFVDAYRTFTALPAPRKEALSVKRLLERVLHLALAEQKQGLFIRTEYSVVPDDLTLQADPAQIEMVLLNLLKNAREALETLPADRQSPASITLQAGLDQRQQPFISVADNGPGIPEELTDEVFIPFFTTKPVGTGVGLSLSRQIMQQHGGTLRVRSEVGKGTVFWMGF